MKKKNDKTNPTSYEAFNLDSDLDTRAFITDLQKVLINKGD
jgi:hypothetical protein